jgi:hypothetical protein
MEDGVEGTWMYRYRSSTMKKEKFQGLCKYCVARYVRNSSKGRQKKCGGSKNQMFTKLSKDKEGRPYALEGENQGGI